MAHGEADPGCAHGETPTHTPDDSDGPVPGRPVRRICPNPGPRADIPVDPDHVREGNIQFGRAPACRSERPGWAGAHRHGAVRPRRRATRRERPPDRWC